MHAAIDDSPPPNRRLRLRFSLLALLLFVTFVCVLLAWLVQPQLYVVEALYQVAAQPATLLGEQPRFDAREYELFCRTQIALLESDFVLQAALRDPAIAALPVVAAQADVVAWLADQLEAEYLLDSDVLAIRMRGTEGQTPDLRLLVDAVCRAYQNEVVFAEDQRRQVVRDAKAKSTAKLRQEITEKMEMLGQIKANSDTFSPEAKVMEMELEVLFGIWQNLIRSVELHDVDAAAPPRIRPLQPATVRRE